MAGIYLGELSASKTGQQVDPSVAQDEFEAGKIVDKSTYSLY